jgi:hypothetical protein
MTVLEAVGLGIPVVARSIPSLSSLGLPAHLTTPSDVAGEVGNALQNQGQLPEWQGRYQEEHSPQRQAAALGRLYRTASEGDDTPKSSASGEWRARHMRRGFDVRPARWRVRLSRRDEFYREPERGRK